ncbi:M14 family zinc carboxypeptidase [Sporosarcina sp. D27]|uniref:M14 family zinc carboxypeptidase n=1 Tax=Sporosarcina sp. D27 TaxID=1382305 RepID=UPI00046FC77B|nr:M14 family zinc carboxypeptidase [Sporosarcina sp. D27]
MEIPSRDIYKATVGTGKKGIPIEIETHGNEKTETEAVLNLLKSIGSRNSRESKKIRDEVTLVFLPKMNLDVSVGTKDGTICLGKRY